MKSKRIALLVQTYLPEYVGGTEIYVHHLAEGLSRRGHHVAVVYHGLSGRKLEGQPYEVLVLEPFRSSKRVHGYRRARGSSPPGFQEFIDEWKPDLVHFHSFALEAGPDHARVLRSANIPYFFTYHLPAMMCMRGTLMRWGNEVCDGKIDPQICGACSLEERYFPRPMAELVAKVSLPWKTMPEGPWLTRLAMPSLIKELRESWREFADGAKHLIACSQWGKETLLKNGVVPEKITVLRQAVPGETHSRALRLPMENRNPLRLGFFGRIANEKGVDIFIDAGRLLRSRGVPVNFEIVGPGSNEKVKWVEEQARDNPEWLRYRGVKHDEDLKEWIRSIDLMVLPSRCLETGPLSLIETWEQGTPSIGSNLGGIHEFFGQNGLDSLLFEPENPVAITEAVQRVMDWKEPSPAVSVPGLEDLLNRSEIVYG